MGWRKWPTQNWTGLGLEGAYGSYHWVIVKPRMDLVGHTDPLSMRFAVGTINRSWVDGNKNKKQDKNIHYFLTRINSKHHARLNPVGDTFLKIVSITFLVAARYWAWTSRDMVGAVHKSAFKIKPIYSEVLSPSFSLWTKTVFFLTEFTRKIKSSLIQNLIKNYFHQILN